MAYKKLPAAKAREIALDGFKVTTLYRNQFPWNCGLKKDGVVWGDCWCMFPKVLIWSWAVGLNPFLDRVEGTYFYDGQHGSYNGIGASGLGDWTGDQIMSNCLDVRSNFFRKDVAELMLISGQHMGMYIGDFSLGDGKLYNSVEFNRYNDEFDGLVPHWTDKYGNRFFWKDGPATGGRYNLIGKLARWIDYSAKPQPEPIPSKDVIAVDGEWGFNTTKLAQKIYKTEVDGIVSHQAKGLVKACPACVPKEADFGSWEFDGSRGYSPMIAAMQKALGLKIAKTDKNYGKFDEATRKAMQKALGVATDGVIGPKTVTAFQKWLNKKAKKK